MTVTAEVNGVEAVQAWAANLANAVTNGAAAAVEAEADVTIVSVSSAMPVDTGWARDRFGETNVPGGFYEKSEDGLTIEFGSDLEGQLNMFEYITRLNEGSSMQAPAGFIDVIAAQAGDRLEARLNEITDTVE